MNDLGWFILFLIILGMLWYAQGGPSGPAPEGPFLDNTGTPVSTANFEIFRADHFEGADSVSPQEPSQHKDEISLYKARATESDVREEYIEIRAPSNNEKSINITGWTVEGKMRLDIKIPQATYLVKSGQVSRTADVFLGPGEKAIIVTGQSPIGTSFRLNKCTGYFSQFQDFSPSLPKDCPYPKDEEWSVSLSDDCLDYIETLPRCQAHFSIPPILGNECIAAINARANYNNCVEIHKNDGDFYEAEWRIYLGRSEEMWKEKRETIILRDRDEKLVDSLSY